MKDGFESTHMQPPHPKVSIASWPAKGGGGPLCAKVAPSHFSCSPAQWLPAAALRWASQPSTPQPPASSRSSPPAPPAFSPSNGSVWQRLPNSLQYLSLSFSKCKDEKKNHCFSLKRLKLAFVWHRTPRLVELFLLDPGSVRHELCTGTKVQVAAWWCHWFYFHLLASSVLCSTHFAELSGVLDLSYFLESLLDHLLNFSLDDFQLSLKRSSRICEYNQISLLTNVFSERSEWLSKEFGSPFSPDSLAPLERCRDPCAHSLCRAHRRTCGRFDSTAPGAAGAFYRSAPP